MGATLSRYEGWAFLAAAIGIVVLMTPRAKPADKRVEANAVLFTVIAGYGILMWFLYNLIIFHDPLYFIHSQYSAQSQQLALQQVGLLGTKGSLLESLRTYGWAVLDDLGPIITIAGAVAIVVVCAFRDATRRRAVAVFALLGAPIAFNVVALWLGQTTIRVPERPPFGMFNDRYGLVALPLVAVAIGLAVARVRWTAVLALAAAGVAFLLFAASTPLTLAEGQSGASSADHGRPEVAASYLHANYHGGEVLADDSRASPFIFSSGLTLKSFVTEAFQPWYRNAMSDPANHVQWVVASDGDEVDQNMQQNPARFRAFQLVATDQGLRLYRRGQ
jgi:hypothetical protein